MTTTKTVADYDLTSKPARAVKRLAAFAAQYVSHDMAEELARNVVGAAHDPVTLAEACEAAILHRRKHWETYGKKWNRVGPFDAVEIVEHARQMDREGVLYESPTEHNQWKGSY